MQASSRATTKTNEIMAQITAGTKEVETLVKGFAHKDISGFTFLFKNAEVAVQNINVDGAGEFSGLKFDYALKLSKAAGMTASVTLK